MGGSCLMTAAMLTAGTIVGCSDEVSAPPAQRGGVKATAVPRQGEAVAAHNVGQSSETLIDFSELDAYLAAHGKLFRYIEVLIRKNGKVVYRYGDTTAPVLAASCSKWLGAATIMKLVEQGDLSLDAPASAYLKKLPPRAQPVTLRKLLSHTAGLRSWESERGTFLHRAPLRRSMYGNLHFDNGKSTSFCYSNVGYNFAGMIASSATGKGWSELFQDEIAFPLGMSHTWFPESRPTLAGGAHVSAEDYSRFLEMFRNDGISMEGRRVLKHETVSEMLKNQTPGVRLECVPHPSRRKQSYGLGLWRQGSEERPQMASHFGSDGYKVFLDYCRDVTAVFAMEFKDARKKRARNLSRSIYEIVERAIPVTAACALSATPENNLWIPPLLPPDISDAGLP